MVMFFSEFFNCTMFSKKGEIRGYHGLKVVVGLSFHCSQATASQERQTEHCKRQQTYFADQAHSVTREVQLVQLPDRQTDGNVTALTTLKLHLTN